MSTKKLIFEEDNKIGQIISVDTSRVLIDVSGSDIIKKIGVGNIIAIQGNTAHEFLIAITDRITRSLKESIETDEDIDEDIPIDISPSDLIKASMIGTYRSIDGTANNTFKRGADYFPQIDSDCFLINGNNLQNFMGILSSEVQENERLKLGHFIVDKNAEAIANGDKFFQRHAAILGSTGSGKSWSVALILERASQLDYPNIIVFDMHGEYKTLCESSNDGFAQRYHIAGPSDIDNCTDETIFLPYWLLNRDEMLSMLLDRSDQNAPNQASRFTLHVRELKEETLKNNQKNDILKTFTVDSPIPYNIKELLQKLKTDDTQKGQGKNGPIKGEWEGKLTRFISRLEAKLDDRRYGFLFMPPTEAQKYDWLAEQVKKLLSSNNNNKGIKIIDFSEVPTDVLPIVTGVLARLLYDVQFWMNEKERTPITIICDEAHLYLPVKEDASSVEKQALGSFERIAKEGRKYGFSIVVVSQRPADVSKTILSQCNNFLALRLTNDADQNVVKRLMPDSLAGLTSIIPLLDKGEAILLGDAILLPSRIKLDKPKIKPNSATKDFWNLWKTKQSDEEKIEKAIEALRSQNRR